MIYLASPYTHPDSSVKIQRFEAVCEAAAKLISEDKLVFCPIAMMHPIAMKGELPGNWEYWEEFDKKCLGACEQLWVLCLEGWQDSTGVQNEILIASELRMPIRYLDPEDYK